MVVGPLCLAFIFTVLSFIAFSFCIFRVLRVQLIGLLVNLRQQVRILVIELTLIDLWLSRSLVAFTFTLVTTDAAGALRSGRLLLLCCSFLGHLPRSGQYIHVLLLLLLLG